MDALFQFGPPVPLGSLTEPRHVPKAEIPNLSLSRTHSWNNAIVSWHHTRASVMLGLTLNVFDKTCGPLMNPRSVLVLPWRAHRGMAGHDQVKSLSHEKWKMLYYVRLYFAIWACDCMAVFLSTSMGAPLFIWYVFEIKLYNFKLYIKQQHKIPVLPSTFSCPVTPETGQPVRLTHFDSHFNQPFVFLIKRKHVLCP